MNYSSTNYLETLQGMLNGNIGFAIGLLMVVAGIITVAVKKESGAGFLMIIGGALITLSPGVFNATRVFLADILSNVGGAETTPGFQTTPGL